MIYGNFIRETSHFRCASKRQIYSPSSRKKKDILWFVGIEKRKVECEKVEYYYFLLNQHLLIPSIYSCWMNVVKWLVVKIDFFNIILKTHSWVCLEYFRLFLKFRPLDTTFLWSFRRFRTLTTLDHFFNFSSFCKNLFDHFTFNT